MIQRFLTDTRGAASIEYALTALLLVVACISAVEAFVSS